MVTGKRALLADFTKSSHAMQDVDRLLPRLATVYAGAARPPATEAWRARRESSDGLDAPG